MLVYLGAVIAGTELIQIAAWGRTARYVSTNPAGHVEIFDEKLSGNLPIRLAAIRNLLVCTPPGVSVYPVHSGVETFVDDWRACVEAYRLETEDWDGVERGLFTGEPIL